MKPKQATSIAATPGKPVPALYECVLVVDSWAAASLRSQAVDLHRLSISLYPDDPGCFLVRAAASAKQLLNLAIWADSMEPNATVRSPSLLCGLVSLLDSQAAPAASITFTA